ncbi:MAG: cysteine desulfurase [Chloroflexi bacterium]|nr:cysteine desulfurase [Chloroflexota bacterium]MYD47372.1 cysteine desulfurase [Chloroflexota bacterium]
MTGAPGHAAAIPSDGLAALDPHRIRQDFPILDQQVNGKPLVYLDNAATTQKPRAVIDAISNYYLNNNANVHRGVHTLSQRATDDYEVGREAVRRFINAPDVNEVIYVRGTTEGLNLVAHSYGRKYFKAGDEVIITGMEHHSNIVPWQILRQEIGIRLRVVPFNDDGELLMDEYESLLNDRTRLVSVVHQSNALGTVNPIAAMAELAHARGIPVLVDAAQSVPHMPVDVQALGADFLTFSGHKLYGPTGIGALWGRSDLLNDMPPYQSGGEMIRSVTFEETIYNTLPHKFEAGTPDIAGAIGLGAAIEYLESIGMERIAAYEQALLRYGTEKLGDIEGVRLIGTAEDKGGILSFHMESAHPHDIGTILDAEGIAVRTGHHCAQPVMARYGVPATVRASLAFYNTTDDIDALVTAIDRVIEVFG